jgi:hypothetical protein
MKKIATTILSVCMLTAGWAQSEKYTKAMEQKIAAIDTSRSMASWQDLANSFERIADAEKTQWLPYYYAALSHVMIGYNLGQGQTGGFADKTDPEAEKAEILIAKAESLSKDNSEIFCVKKMIATLRMMGDPMTRWQNYGPLASEALAKAKELNPNNPRVYLLEGQDKFFTPEQFGGSKSEAKLLFEEAMKKYESFKPESTIHPQWGMSQVKYFHAEASK